MAIIRNSNIEILVAPATIFNTEIKTKEVKLTDYQAAHFVVASGDGAEQSLTAQIFASKDGVTPILLREENITIGGNNDNKIILAARELAHYEFDSVYLQIPNANSVDIIGTIFVVLTNERYAY